MADSDSGLSNLPVELVLDNLFPTLSLRDVLALGATNKSFSTLAEDDTFWKRRLEEDFNFSGARTARKSGWKVIYKGLSSPKTYVWGDRGQGRLGLTRTPRVSTNGVPYPVRLRIPGIHLVDIIAGGWSFYALDSKADIYVWGALDGSVDALSSDGFSVPQKRALTPAKLQLPAKFKSVSCGRLHSMALDAEGYVWNFLNWGRPYRLLSHYLDRSIPGSVPIQIECGWAFSSVLTESGDVYVWFPFGGPLAETFGQHMSEMDAEGGKKALFEDGTIPCVAWDLEHPIFILPALPRLPKIGNQQYDEVDVKLVKVAAMEECLIGLTNMGHVLKINGLTSEQTLSNSHWTYLPYFSEWSKIQAHPDMNIELDAEHKEGGLHITHISAHFRTFVAYSVKKNSIVLIGAIDTGPETGPKIIPSLQDRGVISIVVGDYHYGALTDDGKLLTWGGFSNGALGLGDPQKIPLGQPGGFPDEALRGRGSRYAWVAPPEVTEPTEVKFDHCTKRPRNTLCFAAAAAGWHMGALVVDLDGDSEDDEEEEEEIDDTANIPGHLPHQPHPLPIHSPGDSPGFGRAIHTMPFRVGFAGRGHYLGHRPLGRGNSAPGPAPES